MGTTDEDTLREAQSRLERSRLAAGLGPHAGHGPALRLRGTEAPARIGEAIGPVIEPGTFLCTNVRGGRWERGKNIGGARCNAVIEFPGICAACTVEVEKRAAQKRAAQLINRIPKEYRESTWAAISAGVESRAGGPRAQADRRRMRRIMTELSSLPEGGRAVIFGPAGKGKSTIAAAWLLEEIRRGVERAWWVCADQLEDDTVEEDKGGPLPRDMAITGDSVVIDDLGAELAGAAVGSGMIAVRLAAAAKVIPARARRNFGRLIITTPHDEDHMRSFYGDGIARRVYEGALKIPMMETT